MRTKILVGLSVLLVVGLFAWNLFGPNPAVRVGRQTTFITRPLDSDGLPNYVQALMERQSEGVTPANNGAVLFWAAMGPAEMSAADYSRLCAKIGVDVASAPKSLIDMAGSTMQTELAEWMEAEHGSSPPSDPGDPTGTVDSPSLQEIASDQLAWARRAAWKSEDLPPLARQLMQNEPALDCLVEATARPRFFSPSPNALVDPQLPIIDILLPHAQAARTAAYALAMRTNYHVGAGEYDKAWQNCLAVWRLGGQIAQGPTIVEKLNGIAIRGVGGDCTLALLEAPDLPSDLAQQISADLELLNESANVADALNHGERYLFLDSTLRLTGRYGGFSGPRGLMGGANALEKAPQVLAIDVNVLLTRGNEWFDRMTAAANKVDRDARNAAMLAIEDDLRKMDVDLKSRLFRTLGSRQGRSTAFGDVMAAFMLPATSAAVLAEDRDQANLVLTRAAAALASYRARFGEYPERISNLTPEILDATPRDPFGGQPLRYERRGDGYVLYSVFTNGQDDGGDDATDPIVDGEWVERNETSPPASSHADIVIRLPMPPRKLAVPENSRNVDIEE